MAKMDFERALLLLNVTEKALQHPNLRPIVHEAAVELEAMANRPSKEVVKEEPIVEGETPAPAPVGRRL